MTDQASLRNYFLLFQEIGIIEQLSRARLEARLPDGIIAPHFAVLNHLQMRDGQTPLILANAFQLPKTTMTHTLASLEKHKLVKMRPNPDDARSKRVWLTAKGKTLREKVLASVGPDLMEVTSAVTPEQLDTILPILQSLREYLDNARSS